FLSCPAVASDRLPDNDAVYTINVHEGDSGAGKATSTPISVYQLCECQHFLLKRQSARSELAAMSAREINSWSK
ncbi:hypothetical protein PFISCL1PPCAC_21034, partial [Pristionchus fissidentatus]